MAVVAGQNIAAMAQIEMNDAATDASISIAPRAQPEKPGGNACRQENARATVPGRYSRTSAGSRPGPEDAAPLRPFETPIGLALPAEATRGPTSAEPRPTRG